MFSNQDFTNFAGWLLNSRSYTKNHSCLLFSLRHASTGILSSTASCSRLTSPDGLDAPFANIDTSSVTSMDCLDIDLLVRNAVEKHHDTTSGNSELANNNNSGTSTKILLPTQPLSRSSLNSTTLRNTNVAIVPQSSVLQLGSNNLKVEMEVLDPFQQNIQKKAKSATRRSRSSR